MLDRSHRSVQVLCRDVEIRDVRPELAALNWMFFREDGDDFTASMKLLLRSLDAGRSAALSSLPRPRLLPLGPAAFAARRPRAHALPHQDSDPRNSVGESRF
jgi:hypothetical protein